MTDRASAEGLRAALASYIGRSGWVRPTGTPPDHDRAWRHMLAEADGMLEDPAISAALRDTGPRPDSEIDVERVRYALGQLYPWQSGPTNAKDASRFIREYARLSTPRTETSE